jgi:hypothetical protein
MLLIYMCMSVIVVLVSFVGFGNLTVQWRCSRNFMLTTLCSFFREDTYLLAIVFLPAPYRVATAPTRHSTASLTPLPS